MLISLFDHADLIWNFDLTIKLFERLFIAHYTVKVEGRGFMAEIFRKLLDAISFGAGQKEGNETDAWQECLIGIEPQLISNDDYNIIIGMLFVIVVLCYLSMFQRRFQHRIAGHFYPDAAEARAAWKVGEIFMIRQQVRLQGSRFSLEHLQKGPQHLLVRINKFKFDNLLKSQI